MPAGRGYGQDRRSMRLVWVKKARRKRKQEKRERESAGSEIAPGHGMQVLGDGSARPVMFCISLEKNNLGHDSQHHRNARTINWSRQAGRVSRMGSFQLLRQFSCIHRGSTSGSVERGADEESREKPTSVDEDWGGWWRPRSGAVHRSAGGRARIG